MDAESRMGRHIPTWPLSLSRGTGLAVHAVSAEFRNNTVLQDFSLTINPGECAALVGPSGCGKTTAARVIAGLHRRSAGHITLDGHELAGTMRKRTLQQAASVAYVFQDAKAAFDPYRSVWEQIARGPVRLRGATHSEAVAAAAAALELVGLEEHIAHKRPNALSGGEAQRAAIARALAVSPSVLICDEVTTGLDNVSQRRVLDVLSELMHTQGVSLLMISHDISVVRAVADEIIDMAAHVSGEGQ